MAKPKRSSGSSPGRSYAADAIKATAHPTRQLVLKALRDSERSTVELEEVTGENRYNLYHHLSVLQDAGLVGQRYSDSRTKTFFLIKPKRPDTVFLQFERQDPEDREHLENILRSLRNLVHDRVPHLDRVVRMRIILSYPWSKDEPEPPRIKR